MDKKVDCKEKFRYVMGGTFSGTDGHIYSIDIPAPFARQSEEEAMKDETLAYRFMMVDNIPRVVCFEGQDIDVKRENGRPYLKTRIKGDVISVYTYEQFKELDGSLRVWKDSAYEHAILDEDDFATTDKSFSEIFPTMEEDRTYYIDNEYYCIRKEA